MRQNSRLNTINTIAIISLVDVPTFFGIRPPLISQHTVFNNSTPEQIQPSNIKHQTSIQTSNTTTSALYLNSPTTTDCPYSPSTSPLLYSTLLPSPTHAILIVINLTSGILSIHPLERYHPTFSKPTNWFAQRYKPLDHHYYFHLVLILFCRGRSVLVRGCHDSAACLLRFSLFGGYGVAISVL